MEWFIIVLIACTVALAVAGIVQFHTDSPVAGAKILVQREINNSGVVINEIRRIRWHGTFADPNDLAIAFVLVVPYLIYLASKKKYIIPALSIPPILYGIYLTNSRGAAIAVIMAISSFFIIRKGTIKGAVVALIVVCLLALVGPSRIGTISPEEESAHGRLLAWYEGFQILKINPIFGSGVDTFTEFHEYTAHNSFVLVFAEMGLVGAFFFTGIYFIPVAEALSKIYKKNTESDDSITENNKLVTAALASLVGVLVTMLFLSRSYTFLPYLAAGMVLASVKISNTFTHTTKIVIPFSKYAKSIVAVEFGIIIFLNILLKFLI